MVKKVVFLAPHAKWGTYTYYKSMTEYLQKHYADQYEICFCHSFLNYIKLHFQNTDIIFSVIPFIFKPLWTKKYIYNLHWDYKVERKRRWLWVKLLYFTERNFKFSDSILVSSSYFVESKIIDKKYISKIIEIPISHKSLNVASKPMIKQWKRLKLLTVTNANFLEKWKGIIDIKKSLSAVKNMPITWTIVIGGNKSNRDKILKEFQAISLWNNIKVKLYGWLEKKELEKKYIENEIFLYASRLETWGITIMEALNYALPVILFPQPLWKYIYPEDFVTKDFEWSLKQIQTRYSYYSRKAQKFAWEFDEEMIVPRLVKKLMEPD